MQVCGGRHGGAEAGKETEALKRGCAEVAKSKIVSSLQQTGEASTSLHSRLDVTWLLACIIYEMHAIGRIARKTNAPHHRRHAVGSNASTTIALQMDVCMSQGHVFVLPSLLFFCSHDGKRHDGGRTWREQQSTLSDTHEATLSWHH